MEIKRSITVAAPLDHAWGILTEQFHDVSLWACGISSSRATTSVGPAGIRDRQCDIEGMGTLTESLHTLDINAHTFGYDVVSGAPKMMRKLGNTWTLRSLAHDKTEIAFCIEAELNPVMEALMGWMMKRKMGAMCDQICDDLRAFIESGEVSERKRSELSKRAA